MSTPIGESQPDVIAWEDREPGVDTLYLTVDGAEMGAVDFDLLGQQVLITFIEQEEAITEAGLLPLCHQAIIKTLTDKSHRENLKIDGESRPNLGTQPAY